MAGIYTRTCSVLVKAEAYDFRRQGGFYVRDIIILGELQKLYDEFMELKGVDSSIVLQKMGDMAKIMASIITVAKSNYI